MAGEVAFFELGVEDVGRGRAFYEGLFGWRFERGPSGEGWTIGTGNVPGGMHGGDKGAAPYLFFRVDDMKAALERVRQLGGAVEDMDVEGDEASVARWGRRRSGDG
jgi:predicted enzyme related to lactoylglutathione lyase